MSSRNRRFAFTLLELVVVLAILGVLLALLLPAVQRVREAGNRIQCKNNLREIGLAAHHYHSSHSRLPPGYLGPSPARNTDYPRHLREGQWVGHLPLLLPHLEQEALFRRLDVNFNVHVVTQDPWFWKPGPVSHHENYTAGMTKLKVFRCPSAPEYDPQAGVSGPNRGGTMLGLHVFHDRRRSPFTHGWKDDYVRAAAYRFLAKTNYLGVAGCGSGTHEFFRRYEGLYTNRSQNSLSQLTTQDGTSNTLLYGEACGSQWRGRPRGSQDISWMGGGALGTYLGLQRGQDADLASFSSYHISGVHFCFADGSVRMLQYGDTVWPGSGSFPRDWELLQQLAGRHDGGPTEASRLTD